MLKCELCNSQCAKTKNINFRLTSAAQKRLCLSSLLLSLCRVLWRILREPAEISTLRKNAKKLYRTFFSYLLKSLKWQDFVISFFLEGKKIKGIQLANVRAIVLIVFRFCFLKDLQSDNNSITVYVLGHRYVFGPDQSSFF